MQIKKIVFASAVLFGSILFVDGNETSAASTPTLNTDGEELKIYVDNGENTYEEIELKIMNKKKFIIKKVSFKAKNNYVVKVSKSGIVTAQSPGKTEVIVTIKYQNKYDYYERIKKKKTTVDIDVTADYLHDIPQTGIQYDETGKAKPLYPYTSPVESDGNYSNEASYIDRFPVYVETDYDTDQDGKRDLVMALVQVPRSAVDGYYKAPVFMRTDPYLVDEKRTSEKKNKVLRDYRNNTFNYNLLMNSPNPRVPVQEISTEEASKNASSWIDGMKGRSFRMENVKEFDYFLVRGYACVTSPGLAGSKDSEGLQCCGERVEAKAYAAIIEWLHGDRNAYADSKGTKLLRADWCNGHTAVTGLSYCGTLAYEVAALGAAGLDTVIPVGAIADWYSYVFTQGATVNASACYMASLGFNHSVRMKYDSPEQENKDPIYKTYLNYLSQKCYDEAITEGRYADFWKRLSYRMEKPKVPALLVEGMNDFNVRSKQTEMMKNTFKSAGQTCKIIYHQGAHDSLGTGKYEYRVGDELYYDLVNRWLAHYMAGVNNGIDQMKDYTVQSNIDGSWTSYDEGSRTTEMMRFTPSGIGNESTVRFNSKMIEGSSSSEKEKIQRTTEGMYAVWEQKFDRKTTISGTGEVHLRVKMPDVQKKAPTLYVQLFDECDTQFNAFILDPKKEGSYYAKKYIRSDSIPDYGEGIDAGCELTFGRAATNQKLITEGGIDLRLPNAGWEPETAVKPSKSVYNNTYYNYTVYLDPKEYTIRRGHTLRLYIIPMGGGLNNLVRLYNFVDTYTNIHKDRCLLMSSQYEFTLDNTQSYAELPIVK